MAEVRITVSSIIGNIEAEQVSIFSSAGYEDEKNEIKDLLQKATENIHGAYGITND